MTEPMLRVVVLAFALLVADGASAQSADSVVVTLSEAVALAVEQSPQVRRAIVGDQSRDLAVSAARAGRLPTVTFQASPGQRYGLGFDQTTGQAVSQTVETLNVGIGGSISLYDGGRTRALVRQTQLERDAAGETLERTRQQVALDVAQQFLTLLLDREVADIREEALGDAIAQRTQVNELVEAGARARADLIAQDAVVAERRTAVVIAQGAVERDRVVLIQLVGLDPLTPYRFEGPDLERLDSTGLLDATPAPLDSLLAAARVSRADRRAQELSVAAARAAVGTARAGGRPVVDLNASVGTGYSSLQNRIAGQSPAIPVTLPDGTPILVGGAPFTFPGDPSFETTPLLSQFGDNRSGALGFTVSVPLFDRYQTRRAVAEAEIRTADAQITLDQVDRQIAADVQQALVEARTARAQLDAARVQVDAAAEALRVERDRYRLGAGTLYDVSLAQTRLSEAQSGVAQAAYGLAFRTVLVRLAVGDLGPSELADALTGR